jgi:hypothetical protein
MACAFDELRQPFGVVLPEEPRGASDQIGGRPAAEPSQRVHVSLYRAARSILEERKPELVSYPTDYF